MTKEIFETMDYDLFKFKEYNRKIHKNHVDKLVFSLQRSNDLNLYPIVVDSKMEVVDGQHRLVAARKMGIPVFYVIDDDYDPEKVIQINTTQMKWSLEDYLNFWMNKGKEDYIKLHNMCKDTGLSLRSTLVWVGGAKSGFGDKVFRCGEFHYKMSPQKIIGIHTAKRVIEKYTEKGLKPKTILTSRAFHAALKNFLTNDLVCHSRFLDRIDSAPFMLRCASNWTDYFDQFIEIYNFNTKNYNRLNIVKEKDLRRIIKS